MIEIFLANEEEAGPKDETAVIEYPVCDRHLARKKRRAMGGQMGRTPKQCEECDNKLELPGVNLRCQYYKDRYILDSRFDREAEDQKLEIDLTGIE